MNTKLKAHEGVFEVLIQATTYTPERKKFFVEERTVIKCISNND